jgi:hypothetical protein
LRERLDIAIDDPLTVEIGFADEWRRSRSNHCCESDDENWFAFTSYAVGDDPTRHLP